MYFIISLCKRIKKLGSGRLLNVIVALLILMAGVSYADNNSDTRKRQTNITAEQAAAKAKRQYGGEVLRVKRKGNRYEVKILTPSGTVKTVSVSTH